jgi:hypothetical protein
LNKLTGKKLTNIGPVKSINASGQNFFASQQTTEDFWNSGNKPVGKNDSSFPENIQKQMQQIEAQTEEYKNIFADPYGKTLNIIS